jgi:hypothetical protein
MTDTYQELLIEQQGSQMNKIFGFVLVGLGVLSIISGLFVSPFFFIGAPVCGVLSYIVYFRRTITEYEYTYMDKELRIARIYNRAKRKKMESLDLSKAEAIVAQSSAAYDNYKNMQGEEIDYSTCLPETEELKDYVIIMEGKKIYYFSFNEAMVQAIRTGVPSKVKLR